MPRGEKPLPRPVRRGFSLIEVLLATAILLGSVIVLAELASIGRHHVDSVESLSAAQLLCQSKLNELLAGIRPLEEVSERPLEEAPDWVYTVEIDPVDGLPLLAVRVTVSRPLPEDLPARKRPRKPPRFTLVRWLPDPHAGAVEASRLGTAATAFPPSVPKGMGR